RQAPEIQILGKLRVGHPANITCATFRSCSWQPPKFTWKAFSKNLNFHLWLNGSQVYSSVLDFLPSVADHNRNLTCKVTYRNGSSSVSKEKTVQLDVNFPPQTPVISVARLRPNENLRNFTKASRIMIEKGDSIVLRCKVKGNPLPNVTWVKGSQILGTPLQPSNALNLSDMKEEDAGEYQCQAANTEGSAEASFEVSMAPEDKNNCLLSMVTGALFMLAVVILITGVILVSKRCLRKRKTVTNSETEPKDSALALGKTSPNLKNPSTLDLAVWQMDRISLKPESAEESAGRNPRDPEELYYATLTFNAPNPIPDATSKEIQTDYAEIRRYNSQGQQDMKI
ncbi:sialic acid-binding Ig-like lectin 6, partial [Python bivittatus]|uniref:Sialic acid-binding Ig-like lectin 6 n=1 Tax=Python bivittatus TaxID=176946 RepID=A0A9F5J3D9_PYTBI